MKINMQSVKKVRVEMLPLIDIVFLLLVFFIYAMLSMAVHRGLPVNLPSSSTAKTGRDLTISVTIKADGVIYLDRKRTSLQGLEKALSHNASRVKAPGVLLFADRALPFQKLFEVMDKIRGAGLTRISLQSEVEKK